MAAVAAALLAIRLFAVADGSRFAPFSTWSRGGRLGALLLLLAALLGLTALLVRRPSRPVWLATEAGGALVAPAAIEERIRDAVASHVEVLRARAHVSVSEGKPRADVQAMVRPLAAAAPLQEAFTATARDLLEHITGLEAGPVDVKVRVVPVRRLRRYL